ncbi:hypothetical protein CCACVL1_17379 [Corchorus capsularis]|uniref:Uncharacterized protein n=1 Tax=Corchorus capsularis TaxID=210143 RepID=A0A1R3HSE0_COCAP|nr:hypothetical protein CCACVL1_17379 [Corchorus capsularis]
MTLSSSLSPSLSPHSNTPSVEDSDLLKRSTKRLKDHTNTMEVEGTSTIRLPNCSQIGMDAAVDHQPVHQTYRDKLVNQVDDMQFSFTANSRFLDEESDVEEEDSEDGIPVILLSREEKRRIREPWLHSIIIKTYGKNVGYNFLFPKIKAQWNPKGRMDMH